MVEHLDRGPEFYARRIATIEPPKSCGLYVVRVPKCGPDNNELGTLRLPDITVPIGTYTSWNLRSRSLGAEEELLGLSGGFIPFYDGRVGPGLQVLGSRTPDEDYSEVLSSLKRPHLDYFKSFYGDTAMFGGSK